MRKLTGLFVAFSLALSCLNAQTASYVADYYPLVNKAEMAVVAEDYAQALQSYQSAFSALKGGFARDYHNAALCAMKTGQAAVALDFFEKMALKGVTWEYFKQAVFIPLHSAPGWKKFEAGYDKLHQQHLAGTDLVFRHALTEMADLDQLFRQQPGSYAEFGDTIRKIDSMNIRRFSRLLKAIGFPSEDRIGTDFPGQPAFQIVLHHHAQHLSQPLLYPGWPDLAPALVAAAQAGEMEPPKAAFLLELQNGPAYRLGAFGLIGLVVDGTKQPEYYLDLPTNRPEADRARAAMGLEPLADFVDKCRYRLSHPDTPFRLNDGWPANIFQLDEASAQGLKNALFKVEVK